MTTLGISVIVTTYNWPQALNRVLSGLFAQDYSQFEIIIADDGSGQATQKLIEAWQGRGSIPLIHCWQSDEGFRASKIRNIAAAKAKYDYLVFLDGDCIPRSNFVLHHALLAEEGWLVKGHRILLNQPFTTKILQENIPVETWGLCTWAQARLQGDMNRFLPLIDLMNIPRKCAPQKWQGVKMCNVGVWRKDFIKVNGLDESFIGWGYEDSDLVIRLQRAKVRCKSGKYAVGVLHLWHKEQDRSMEIENKGRLERTLVASHIKASKGIEQYII